jgi:imidazoleglycerol phosphate synthase glutamine amidotransferase subunit HisH
MSKIIGKLQTKIVKISLLEPIQNCSRLNELVVPNCGWSEIQQKTVNKRIKNSSIYFIKSVGPF